MVILHDTKSGQPESVPNSDPGWTVSLSGQTVSIQKPCQDRKVSEQQSYLDGSPWFNSSFVWTESLHDAKSG